jgi:hypothetical protein
MNRPFTDISKSISANPIKNGTLVTSTTFTGKYSINDRYVKNTPNIDTIASKYGYRFYNGIFVQLTDDQNVVGG